MTMTIMMMLTVTQLMIETDMHHMREVKFLCVWGSMCRKNGNDI